MTDSRIARVRAYAVPAAVADPAGTPVEGGGLELLRLTLADGSEGVASARGDCADAPLGEVVDAAAAMAVGLLGMDAAQRVALHDDLNPDGEATTQIASLCDIALWDAWGHHLGVPVWQMLGGFRERLPAYASLSEPGSLEEALDSVRRVAAMGYRGVKLQMGSDPAFDLELVATLDAAFGDGELQFMVDLEQRYSFEDALCLGRRLSELGFAWMEAPLPDSDLAAYLELNRAVTVDILPAGDTLVGSAAWLEGLQGGAWSRLRADACSGGGITGLLRAMALADALDVGVELQSVGHPPAQAANLHLMLGVPGCTWFEHHDPLRPLDYGVASPLKIDPEGRVAAPEGPGLGLLMDFARIEADAVETFDSAA
jgi:L-alanine-DL-glutamate epimerase-like enolase superfamily enzyme